MKILKTTLLCAFCVITTSVFSQSVKNKTAKFVEYIHPQIPVAGIEKIKISVYSGADLELSQGDLYERKGLGKRLQAKQDQINNIGPNYVTFQDYTLVGSGEDAEIELAFGAFEQLGKQLKDHKIVCVRDDGKLDKDDLKECPAYYYEVSYNLPVIAKISDRLGQVLAIERFDAQSTVTFGYDASGLTGYLATSALNEAFAKPTTIQSIKKDAIQDRLSQAGDFIQENFCFQAQSVKIDISSGGGKLDYSDLDEAQELAITALENLTSQSARDNISSAIAIWDKALEEVDMNDNKARINRRLAGFIALNKAKGQYYMQEYDNAMASVDEAAKYLKFSANTAHMESVNSWKSSIRTAQGNALSIEKNQSLVNANPIGAAEIIEMIKVKEKDAPYEIVQTVDKYDFYNEEYIAALGTQEQNADVDASQSESVLASLLMGGGMTESGDVDWEGRMQKAANLGYYITIAYSNNETIPEGICQLEPLNTLLANNAKITSVPAEIGQLSNLNTLNLASNGLTAIPEEIGQLENLKKLNLSKNQLTSLPASLSNCKNLKSLMLKGNTIPKNEIDKLQAALPDCKIKL